MGFELRHGRMDPVSLNRTVRRERIATVREDRVRESSAGLHFENVLRWSDSVRMIAALRYDRYRYRFAEAGPGPRAMGKE